MEWENPLYADAVGNLAHGERGPVAAAIDLDHDALECLHAFLLALAYLDVHAHGVANAKLGEIASKRAVFDLLDDAVHETVLGEPTNLSKRSGRLNRAFGPHWFGILLPAREVGFSPMSEQTSSCSV